MNYQLISIELWKIQTNTRRLKVLKLHLQTSQRADSWNGGGSNDIVDLNFLILDFSKLSDQQVENYCLKWVWIYGWRTDF